MFARITSKSLALNSLTIAKQTQSRRFLAEASKTATPKDENKKMAEIWLKKFVVLCCICFFCKCYIVIACMISTII